MTPFSLEKDIKTNKKSFFFHTKLSLMVILLFVIGIAIGLLITAQWRTQPLRASDPVISYASLSETKESLLEEQTDLKKQIKNLNTRAQDSRGVLRSYSDSKQKVETAEEYEQKIGLTDISGSGVMITLDDSDSTDEASVDSIAHAADLRDIINLLWGKGAEAISVNNERIVYNTSIDCIVNTVLINVTKTTPPFKIKAIGNPDIIVPAIESSTLLSSIHARVDEEGLIFNVEKNDELEIPAYHGDLIINYAKTIQ